MKLQEARPDTVLRFRQIHAVTGAFGYSGKYIAQRLLQKGQNVITLTNSLQRKNPFGEKVKAYPFNFDNKIIDAIGPETFTYRNLVEKLGNIIGKHRPLISTPPSICYIAGVILGKMLGDIMLTREEIEGLMTDLLCTDSPPAGETKLTDWARNQADSLGKYYSSELARRRDRLSEYKRKIPSLSFRKGNKRQSSGD